MHWHLALALLLTAFVCSARSECQSFAELVKQVKNTGRGNYRADVSVDIKFQKSGSKERSGSSAYLNAMQTLAKERIATSVSAGVVFIGIGESASVSYRTEYEVKEQISAISSAEWKEMAKEAMDKKEMLRESYDVPPGSGLDVFQVRLTCDGYELSLPKLIAVFKSI